MFAVHGGYKESDMAKWQSNNDDNNKGDFINQLVGIGIKGARETNPVFELTCDPSSRVASWAWAGKVKCMLFLYQL